MRDRPQSENAADGTYALPGILRQLHNVTSAQRFTSTVASLSLCLVAQQPLRGKQQILRTKDSIRQACFSTGIVVSTPCSHL